MPPKKVPVTLTYASPGAQPPIFLAGSFSEPEWHPQEMDFTTANDGEHTFYKEISADEGGNFQYKFRIGNGDWWALNELAPIATDDLGNRNNLLSVPTSETSTTNIPPSVPDSPTPGPNIPIPEVVVEKIDEQLCHGDDFGPSATREQRDAHEKRAQDTEPDHILIGTQANTPVYANTAAEVADSAALLDREPSPAPISDEEAGRTGQRRMSRAPIPQVALTAAEVADSAAILDQDHATEIPPIDFPHEDLSGYSTLGQEAAPLFAHECIGSEDVQEEPHDTTVPAEPIAVDSIPPEAKDVDLNDPSIEEFPSDRLSIFAHVRSAESRLSEDETNFDGIPASPIVRSDSRSPSVGAPSSTRLDAQPSPLLGAISEERQDSETYFGGLPSPKEKVAERNSQDPAALNAIEEADEVDEPRISNEPKLPKVVLEDIKRIEETHKDNGNTADTVEQEKILLFEPGGAEKLAEQVPPKEQEQQAEEFNNGETGKENGQYKLLGSTIQTDADLDESQNSVYDEIIRQPIQCADQPATSSTSLCAGLNDKDVLDGSIHKVGKTGKSINVERSALNQPPLEWTRAQAIEKVDGPPTANDDVSFDVQSVSHISAKEIPRIHIKSATEIKESDDALPNGAEPAKSTTIEDLLAIGDGDSQLKLRNSAQPERPLTPSSFTPPSIKGKESSNFLGAIWRTVFVGWIGGLIAQLCGGERGPLVATSAIVIISVAFAVYFSRMG